MFDWSSKLNVMMYGGQKKRKRKKNVHRNVTIGLISWNNKYIHRLVTLWHSEFRTPIQSKPYAFINVLPVVLSVCLPLGLSLFLVVEWVSECADSVVVFCKLKIHRRFCHWTNVVHIQNAINGHRERAPQSHNFFNSDTKFVRRNKIWSSDVRSTN